MHAPLAATINLNYRTQSAVLLPRIKLECETAAIRSCSFLYFNCELRFLANAQHCSALPAERIRANAYATNRKNIDLFTLIEFFSLRQKCLENLFADCDADRCHNGISNAVDVRRLTTRSMGVRKSFIYLFDLIQMAGAQVLEG